MHHPILKGKLSRYAYRIYNNKDISSMQLYEEKVTVSLDKHRRSIRYSTKALLHISHVFHSKDGLRVF